MAAAEDLCQLFHRNEGLACVVLRTSRFFPEEDDNAAVRSVYARLGEILKARGLTFANVAKETVYTTALDAFIRSKETRKTFYAGALPAADGRAYACCAGGRRA